MPACPGVYTYGEATGWGELNFASTLGAFIIAAAVALFLFDFARKFRFAPEDNAGNVWEAGTLEWLPNGNYSSRSIPQVTSRYPLWDQPGLSKQVEQGQHYLPNAPTGRRETLLTHPLDAHPQALLRMPAPGWAPFVAAVFTAAFFMLLTVKLELPTAVCAVIAVGALLHWAWQLDPPPLATSIDIGGGIAVPVYVSGPVSSSWWAMVVLMLVAASLFGCALFSYVYLWIVAPGTWPAASAMPPARYPLLAAAMIAASSAAFGVANRWLARDRSPIPAMAIAIVLLACGSGVEAFAHRIVSPTASGYGAIVWAIVALEGFHVVAVIVLAAFAIARCWAGHIDRKRRNVFDNVRIFWHYVAAQTLGGLLLVHGFPRLAG